MWKNPHQSLKIKRTQEFACFNCTCCLLNVFNSNEYKRLTVVFDEWHMLTPEAPSIICVSCRTNELSLIQNENMKPISWFKIRNKKIASVVLHSLTVQITFDVWLTSGRVFNPLRSLFIIFAIFLSFFAVIFTSICSFCHSVSLYCEVYLFLWFLSVFVTEIVVFAHRLLTRTHWVWQPASQPRTFSLYWYSAIYWKNGEHG